MKVAYCAGYHVTRPATQGTHDLMEWFEGIDHPPRFEANPNRLIGRILWDPRLEFVPRQMVRVFTRPFLFSSLDVVFIMMQTNWLLLSFRKSWLIWSFSSGVSGLKVDPGQITSFDPPSLIGYGASKNWDTSSNAYISCSSPWAEACIQTLYRAKSDVYMYYGW